MVSRPSQAVKPAPTKVVSEEDQDQTELTATASLKAVKHLVETSLGCLTYLRGIFPDDHFSDEMVPGGRVTPSSTHNARRNGSIKVKKLGRGHSVEGDRFLDYWEGVQEAIDHEYLSSLIMAVYLDPNEPENLVESYTFNFTYTDTPGSSKKAVSMDFEEQMRGISIFDGKKEQVNPTARDVRSSSQSIIRSLITLTQCLPELPRKRYITLKLFYTDETPQDYEPPRFKASSGHNFIFKTKNLHEGPDQAEIGALLTGHHGVSLSIASLTHLLPPSIQEEEDEELAGEGEELDPERRKALDHELQLKDAASRKVIWDAEERSVMGLSCDPKALGAVIEEEGPTSIDAEERERRFRTGLIRRRGDPLGIISSTGVLRPIPRSAREEAIERQKRRFQGEQVENEDVEDVEMFVAKIVEKEWTSDPRADLARSTTSNSLAQTIYDSHSLSNGETGDSSPPQAASQRAFQANGSQAGESGGVASASLLPDLGNEMSIESQTQSQSQAYSTRARQRKNQESEDPIESFSTQGSAPRTSPRKKASPDTGLNQVSQVVFPKEVSKPKPGYYYEEIAEEHSQEGEATLMKSKDDQQSKKKNRTGSPLDDGFITCLCQDLVEDGLMAQCEAKECIEKGSGWLHAACYGYTEKSIDQAHVFCYDHELIVGNSPREDIESVRLSVMNKLASLTLMRRALHVIHRDGWQSGIAHFAGKIGCDLLTAKEVASSLESEGYISKEDKTKRKQSSKLSKKQPSHYIHKHRKIIKKRDEVYFTPKGGAEAEILGEWIAAGGNLLSEKGIDEDVDQPGSQSQYYSSAQNPKSGPELGLFENSQTFRTPQRTSPPTDPIDLGIGDRRPSSELSEIGEEEAKEIDLKCKEAGTKLNVASSADDAPFAMARHPRDASPTPVDGENHSSTPMIGQSLSGLKQLTQSDRQAESSSITHGDLASSPSGRKRSRKEIDGEIQDGEKGLGVASDSTIRSSSYNLRERARKRPTKNIKTSMTAGIELDDVEME